MTPGDDDFGSVGMVANACALRSGVDCDGLLLPMEQNSALFAVFGDARGGDGRTTFALPACAPGLPRASPCP